MLMISLFIVEKNIALQTCTVPSVLTCLASSGYISNRKLLVSVVKLFPDATLATVAQDALYDDVAHKQLLSSLNQVPSCSQ